MTSTMSFTEVFKGTPEEVYDYMIFFHLQGRHHPMLTSRGSLPSVEKKAHLNSKQMIPTEWDYPRFISFDVKEVSQIHRRSYYIHSNGPDSDVRYEFEVIADGFLGRFAASSFRKEVEKGEYRDGTGPHEFFIRLANNFNTRVETGYNDALQQFREQFHS